MSGKISKSSMIVQVQEGAFYPYDDDAVSKSSMLKDNATFEIKFTKVSTDYIRSLDQNRLYYRWLGDLVKQGDQTKGEYRAYCKLHFGVGLLRQSDAGFDEVYQRIIRPLTYEQKLELMVEPIDLPLTSRMDTKTMSMYLKMISDHFMGEGFHLTGLEHLAEWALQDAA